MRRHARIHGIRQLGVILLERLNHCSGVDTGRRAKCVFTHHRIVRGNWDASPARDRIAVVFQPGQVLGVPGLHAHEFQVDQKLVHLRVAHALARAQRTAVNAIGSGGHGREGIRNT